LITARGQNLEFYKNDTGTYIASEQVTAKILRMDVITSNGELFSMSSIGRDTRVLIVLFRHRSGVIHVIDRFLANPDSNNAAASSASVQLCWLAVAFDSM
jgi:hypothetical protein